MFFLESLGPYRDSQAYNPCMARPRCSSRFHFGVLEPRIRYTPPGQSTGYDYPLNYGNSECKAGALESPHVAGFQAHDQGLEPFCASDQWLFELDLRWRGRTTSLVLAEVVLCGQGRLQQCLLAL